MKLGGNTRAEGSRPFKGTGAFLSSVSTPCKHSEFEEEDKND